MSSIFRGEVSLDKLVNNYTREEVERLLIEQQERIWEQVSLGHFELNYDDWAIKFFLNFDLAQCKSKTKLAICSIALSHYENQQKYKNSEKNIKLISVVFTNNSLMEGKAWQSRLGKFDFAKFNTGNVTVQRLASDVKQKNSKDHSNVKALKSAFMSYGANPDNNILGDVLVMCNHPKRIKDILEVIHDVTKWRVKSGITFKYNIFFDECDNANCLTQMTKFIKILDRKKLSCLIDEIHLITATPTEEMVNRLRKITPDADKLYNLRNKINEIKGVTNRVKDYRTIIDQTFYPQEGPEEPVSYIEHLSISNPNLFRPGKHYFIPSSHYCKNHEKMANLKLFKDNGLHVLILNGKNKEIRSPLGKVDKLKFRDDNGEKIELRDILREWKKNNPTAGIVITGKTVLERGLTFLTNGFQFDYLIVSRYFANNIHNLVQLVGRGHGNEKYVDKFTLIMPQSLYDIVKKYITDCENILEESPEFYDQKTIANIGKEDPFLMIHVHSELSIDALARWINLNLKNKNKKPARMAKSLWKKKETDENGFIKHKFGEYGEKIWSEEEALKVRGGLSEDSHRIFPCYTNLQDRNSLKWYVFYNDGTENEN